MDALNRQVTTDLQLSNTSNQPSNSAAQQTAMANISPHSTENLASVSTPSTYCVADADDHLTGALRRHSDDEERIESSQGAATTTELTTSQKTIKDSCENSPASSRHKHISEGNQIDSHSDITGSPAGGGDASLTAGCESEDEDEEEEGDELLCLDEGTGADTSSGVGSPQRQQQHASEGPDVLQLNQVRCTFYPCF